MKDAWTDRYRDADIKGSADVLVGFNANIDVIHDASEIDLEDVEPEERDSVSSAEELRSTLKYYVERDENREIELEAEVDIEGGEEKIGGQAGIMANFLSGRGDGVIFYTPLLSEELAQQMNERVLYPEMEDGFVLKNVRDCSNTDRTKRNLIFEFSGEKTGRVIFSSRIKGFGPYFRSGIEDNFDQLNQNNDRIILSGFHDVEGNKEAKMAKAARQMNKLGPDIHLEYAHRDSEISNLIIEHLLPRTDSLGIDGNETRILADELDIEISEDLTLGDCFSFSRRLIDEFGLSRVHIHTYRFQVVVTREDYEVESERIRDAMVYAEMAGITTADTGTFPSGDLEFREERMHIHDLDDLRDFQEFFRLNNFTETGTAEIEDYKVVAVPTVIHEDPERLVGLGDVISAGAFTGEVK